MTTNEKQLIIAALHAVAPNGGGSDQYHLANRLAAEWDVQPLNRVIGELQTIAHDECAETLGLPLNAVRVKIGENAYPPSGASGGS